MIKRSLFGVLLLCVAVGVAEAEQFTRKQVQLLIRESISEEEFARMVQIHQNTGQSWSDIFDNIIEPDREEMMRNRGSTRRYVVPEDQAERLQSRRGQQGYDEASERAIDANAANSRMAEERPIAVKQDRNPRRRQGLYSSDGERRQEEQAGAGSNGGELPATSIRSRLHAARAAERAGAEAQEDEPVRQSRLYRASGRQEPDKDAADEEEETDLYDSGFGADVLGQRESKVFGQREDRFKGFGSKKDHERKMFRSGTINNNERKTSMFGKDEEEE